MSCRYTTLAFSYLICHVDKVPALFTTAPPEGAVPPAEPEPTAEPLAGSLGVVANCMTSKHAGKVEVTEFRLGVQLSPQMQVSLSVWARQGRMKLNVCYSEAFYIAETLLKVSCRA